MVIGSRAVTTRAGGDFDEKVTAATTGGRGNLENSNRSRIARLAGYVAILLLVIAAARLGAPQETAALPPASSIKVEFARDIEPIFKNRCLGCHGVAVQSGQLRLD